MAEFATDELRARIFSGQLKGGTRLSEEELAQKLGVSRTPIRDALRRLADEGLVHVSPHRGTHVHELTPQDAIEMTVLRETLEALAFRTVAPVITDDDVARLQALYEANREACIEGEFEAVVETDTAFHDFVVRRTGNRRLMDFARRLSVLRLALWLGRYRDAIRPADLFPINVPHPEPESWDQA